MFIPIFILLSFSLFSSIVSADTKSIIGWIEPVKIVNGDFILNAKIDTGADRSSIHSSDIQEFSHEGKPWVRFQLQDDSGKTYQFEQPVIRIAKIKRQLLDTQKRPVVHLGICLGTQFQVIEVNLTNRKTYNYNLLIGRDFLENRFLIDAAAKHLTTPQCDEK